MLTVLIVLTVAGVVAGAWMNDRLRHPKDAAAAPTSAPTSSAAPPSPEYATARRLLDALPVKGWDRVQDFRRYRFGERWSDDVDVEFGHNGCNTRDDVLRRDLVDIRLRGGTCLVQRGTLHDPYTGEVIEFVRGPESSETVQIDHLVSLADAWYKGARAWDDSRRRDFANDPLNLLAVSGPANFDKAFRDAAGWLPPNVGYRCEFVARQVTVKTTYRLWVSANEKAAMRKVLRSC